MRMTMAPIQMIFFNPPNAHAFKCESSSYDSFNNRQGNKQKIIIFRMYYQVAANFSFPKKEQLLLSFYAYLDT